MRSTMPSGSRMRRRRQRRRGTSSAQLRAWVRELAACRSKGPVQHQQHRGVGTMGGGTEGPCSTSLVLPRNGGNRTRPPSASCPPQVGQCNCCCRSKRAGPTLENVLPDFGDTMSTHDTVASKFPTETMVKVACSFDFSIPKPPRGIFDGQQWKPGFPLAPL